MMFKKTMIKRISALFMVLIISMSCALPAFAHSSGGGSHSGGADLTSDSNKTYAYYPDCGLYFASTGSVPLIPTNDISAYFSSFPNPSILFNHLHTLYNNSSYPDVSIYPDYIVYISTWGRASVVFFDYRNPRWSKITLSNNVLHFEGMEQKDYFIASGIYCSNSSVDSFGHYGTYIYPVQNMQYGQTKSLDDNFSGDINDNVYSSNCVTIISSSVPVYTSDGETVFEPDEPPGTFEEEEEENTTEYPELSDNVYQDPHEGEQAPSFPSFSDYDNIFDFMKHFLPDAFCWLGNVIVWYLQEIRYYLAFIVERLHGMLVYFRSLFVVLTNNLEVMFNNLSSALVRYVNGIITRMNFLNAKLLTALNDLKGVNENGFDAVSDALSHLQLSYNESVTNTEINNDFSTVNNKLETVNSSIQDLSSLFKPSDGSAPATNIWDFLSTVAETLGGMVCDLANASSDIMKTLGDVIKSCFENLIELLKQMLDLLFVPDKDNIHDIVEHNSPAIAQLSDLRSRFSVSSVNATNIEVSHFEVPVTTVNGDADIVSHVNADGETSGTINLVFDLSQIPDSIKNPLHSMSTVILYVVQIFITIRAFFKMFGVNIGGSEE